MADFKEVAKHYARLCKSYPDCGVECPINKIRSADTVCRYWTLVVDPETAEKVIMDWAEKHPHVTNRDKFIEVFGNEPLLLDIWNLKGVNWLLKEYKEPEKND